MKKKKYRYPATKTLKSKLIPCWKKLEKIEDEFGIKVQKLEKQLEKETGILRIEFFWCVLGVNYYFPLTTIIITHG